MRFLKAGGVLVFLAALVFSGAWGNEVSDEKRSGAFSFAAFLSSKPDAQGQHHVERLTQVAGHADELAARIDGARSWRVRLLSEEGRVLAEARVGDPTLALLGAEQSRLPLVIRFPDAVGAILVEVLDGQGRLRAEVPLDDDARVVAQDNRLRAQAALAAANKQA